MQWDNLRSESLSGLGRGSCLMNLNKLYHLHMECIFGLVASIHVTHGSKGVEAIIALNL